MSYDAYIMVDTGGITLAEIEWIGNMTSNCEAIWEKALGAPLSDFNHWHCSACIDIFEHAATKMMKDREQYMILEPGNGWGSVNCAARFLMDIADRCKEHPNALLELSY